MHSAPPGSPGSIDDNFDPITLLVDVESDILPGLLHFPVGIGFCGSNRHELHIRSVISNHNNRAVHVVDKKSSRRTRFLKLQCPFDFFTFLFLHTMGRMNKQKQAEQHFHDILLLSRLTRAFTKSTRDNHDIWSELLTSRDRQQHSRLRARTRERVLSFPLRCVSSRRYSLWDLPPFFSLLAWTV